MRAFVALIPSLLLVGIASAQIVAARSTLLTPWKGGGFGMFSTVDAPHARFVRIILETPDGEKRVPVPDTWREEAAVLRAVPTQARADQLAGALVDETWVAETWIPAEVGYAQRLRASGIDAAPAVAEERIRDLSILGLYRPLSEGETSTGLSVAVEGIRVEVWRYHFNGKTLRLEAELLRRARAARRR
jgi:hypothetical protein